MLTGDTNLVDVEFVVQWQIASLRDYRFNVEEPRALIRDTAQSVVRAQVAKRPIDDVLFAGKSQIETQAAIRMQELLDGYGAGVRVRSVQFQEVKPPAKVADAFRDLESAGQDKERLILEAQGYRDQVVPQARGQAQEVVAQAEAYKAAKILEAEGAATRFSALLVEYKKAPGVTRERLYLETLEKILPRMDKVIMDGKGERVMPYLPLERRTKP
jgi:membrane protease subunit HflK